MKINITIATCCYPMDWAIRNEYILQEGDGAIIKDITVKNIRAIQYCPYCGEKIDHKIIVDLGF
jgi:hypothetical protein